MRITKYKTILVKEEAINYSVVDKSGQNPQLIYNVLTEVFKLHQEPQECVYMVALNAKGKIIGISQVSKGTVNTCSCAPRDILREALVMNAACIIVAHNHPSGDTKPSYEDIEVTKQLREAGNTMGIPLVDHIIVGDGNGFTSMKEVGVL